MPTSTSTADSQRLELIRLAQANRPWGFLPRAIQWLKAHDDDLGVRFLAATNAANLGLKVLAQEFLKPLPPEALSDARVSSLLNQIEQLEDTEIKFSERLNRVSRVVALLSTRGHELSDVFEQWQASSASERWFRAIDGNIVRRTNTNESFNDWDWPEDLKGPARAFCQSTIECDAYTAPPPIVVEGINPPWILESLIEALPTTRTGYSTALYLVQQSLHEFFDGLACADLHDIIADPRIQLFLGEDCNQQLQQFLEKRIECESPGRHVLNPSTKRVESSPSVQSIVQTQSSNQGIQLTKLTEKTNDIYEPRNAAWWTNRFDFIRSAPNTPIKVLILSTQYTSFVQHSASDLAEAVRAAGGEAQIIIEPDRATRLSKLAHLKSIAEFQPDMLVLTNYTRAILGEQIPQNLPVVCWIQDAMEHLFDPNIGNAQGPFDVLMGHYYAELFNRHGYKKDRYFHTPVAACEKKFHPGTCTAENRKRFECDIAYVSHHSETPEALLERLKGEAQQPEVRRLQDALAPTLREHASNLVEDPLRPALKGFISSLAADHLPVEPNPKFINDLIDQFAIPLIERIVRHQMLDWASQIASEHDWKLRIYGRGWDQHPSLSQHAAGPLDHNDDLRSCYQIAKVQLHASVSPLTHQRLMECSLSGGFPMAQLNHDAIGNTDRVVAATGFAPHSIIHQSESTSSTKHNARFGNRCRLADRAIGYRLTDSPALLSRAAQLQRLGHRTANDRGDIVWCNQLNVRANLRLKDCGLLDWNAAKLFGDLSEHTFDSRETFEQLLLRAVGDDNWRRARSNAMASRIRAHATHSAMLTRFADWFPTS